MKQNSCLELVGGIKGEMKRIIIGVVVVLAAIIGLPNTFRTIASYSTTEETEVLELTREEILSSQTSDFSEGMQVKWDGYRQRTLSVHDGIIPITKLSEPIYLSMNLPSETRSDDMINGGRDNGYITSKMQPNHSIIQGIGSIYKTSGEALPESFTLCLGKIKTFAYMKSVDNWVMVDEQAYPTGVYLYKLPWTEHASKKCENIQKYDDHIEISLTAEEFESYVLHFWGKMTPVNRDDILYVACAYDFWIKETGYDGRFTATIGIDAKDSKGSQASIKQLFTGRGLSVTSERRTHWGQTIPNDEYKTIRDGMVLTILYGMN